MIGDHTDQQVADDAVERRARDREPEQGPAVHPVRLVIDPGNEGVVYKTADFHKPWDIGLTPDAAIQAKIDALNAQLLPILGT